MSELGDDIKKEMFKELEEYGVEATNIHCLVWLKGLKDVWVDIPADGADEEYAKILYEMSLNSLIFEYQMKILFPRIA